MIPGAVIGYYRDVIYFDKSGAAPVAALRLSRAQLAAPNYPYQTGTVIHCSCEKWPVLLELHRIELTLCRSSSAPGWGRQTSSNPCCDELCADCRYGLGRWSAMNNGRNATWEDVLRSQTKSWHNIVLQIDQ